MRFWMIGALSLTAALAACAAAPMRPSEAELAVADSGPFPDQWEAAIKSHMNERLKDPESARYDFFRRPTKFYSGYNAPYLYGWGTCVYINSKNSFGGYTGKQIGYFFLRGNEVLESINADGSESREGLVREKCSHLPVD